MRDRIEESQSFPKKLEPNKYRNIICFAPHPDDEVQGCGGFFRLATLCGSSVKVIILTSGDPSGLDTDTQRNREHESFLASKILGTSLVFEGLQDRTLRGAEWLSERVAAHIRAVKPDLICLPSPGEMHPDHQATSTAALAAAYQVGYVGDICFYETGGVLNQPTHLIAIDSAVEAKEQALACFVSQELAQPYASRIQARDHFRALTLGPQIKAAEAFEIFCLGEKDQLKLYSHLQPWQATAFGRVAYQQEIPKITVIVRTTGHPHLQTAIASILNQTLPAHEILLVHAIPANVTANWISVLSPSIHQFDTSKRLTRAQAANFGLAQATGEYAIFLDEDDHFLPSHLESLVNAVQAQPTAVGALSQTILVDGKGTHIKTLDYGYLPDRLLFHNLYPIHSILFRTSHILNHGFKFNENLETLEDWDFWIQVSRNATLAESGSATCVYVVTNRSGVGDSGEAQHQRHTQILANWVQRLGIAAYLSPMAQLANRIAHLEDGHRDLSAKLSESEQLASIAKQEVVHWSSVAVNVTDQMAKQTEVFRQQQELQRLGMEGMHQQQVQLTAHYSTAITQVQTIKAELDGCREQIDGLQQSNIAQALALEEQMQKSKAVLLFTFLSLPVRHLVARVSIGLRRRKLQRVINGVRYLIRGDLKGFSVRLREHFLSQPHDRAVSQEAGMKVRILTTRHASFVAKLLRDDLALLGCQAEIVFELPLDYLQDERLYFVLCAQMFEHLPPGDRRIVVQLEQLINKNWHSSSYFKDMSQSLAVLEFSQANLSVLAQYGLRYPHIFYLPLGPRLDEADLTSRGKGPAESAGFLFYGSWKPSARRTQTLDELERQGFNTARVDNIFGADLIPLLREAKAVINIHYDMQNVMEAPRLFECLSMGVPVISEPSSDSDDYVQLAPALTIAETQTPSAIAQALTIWESPDVDAMQVPLKLAQAVHRFHFFRAMIACGPFEPDLNNIPYPLDNPMRPDVPVVLSLPETFQRRAAFIKQWPEQIPRTVFNGIRHQKGWIGCALSYRTLARWALAQGLSRLIVAEDDVSLPPNFSEQLPRLLHFLDQVDRPWDVYCGLIAVLDDPVNCLHRYTQLNLGHDILLIDRFKSMVFNIFNRSSLEYLAAWNPNAGDEYTNTIDMYLDQKPNIRTLVSCPFLVGHAEDLHSTLWGIQNNTYNPLISATQNKLNQLIPKV